MKNPAHATRDLVSLSKKRTVSEENLRLLKKLLDPEVKGPEIDRVRKKVFRAYNEARVAEAQRALSESAEGLRRHRQYPIRSVFEGVAEALDFTGGVASSKVQKARESLREARRSRRDRRLPFFSMKKKASDAWVPSFLDELEKISSKKHPAIRTRPAVDTTMTPRPSLQGGPITSSPGIIRGPNQVDMGAREARKARRQARVAAFEDRSRDRWDRIRSRINKQVARRNARKMGSL